MIKKLVLLILVAFNITAMMTGPKSTQEITDISQVPEIYRWQSRENGLIGSAITVDGGTIHFLGKSKGKPLWAVYVNGKHNKNTFIKPELVLELWNKKLNN